MLKILQGRLQQYINWELLDDLAGFREDRGTRDYKATVIKIGGIGTKTGIQINGS